MTATKSTIERLDGTRISATRVRHLRTLTGGYGGRNDDIELYRLPDGTEIQCISPSHDCRVMPRECNIALNHYPGHRPGE